MKLFLPSLFVFLLFPLIIGAQDNWGLIGIVSGPTGQVGFNANESIRPVLLEYNESGGKMEVLVNNKISNTQFCKSKYQFVWDFSRPLSELRTKDEFNVSFEAKTLQGICRGSDVRMTVQRSVGYSDEYKSLGIKTGTGGINFPKYQYSNWVFANSWRDQQNTYFSNTAFGQVVPWGGEYATFRMVFETRNQIGSERLSYEVVYVYKKNAKPQITTQSSSGRDCPNYNSWYWLAEDHVWAGLGINKLRQMGYKELYYYHISGSGGSYFLKDPQGYIVRIHGVRVFYVSWECFRAHWSLDFTESLNSGNLLKKETFVNKQSGAKLVFNYLR